MKHVDEYRDNGLVEKLSGLIRRNAVRNYTFMEVCGGHTAAIRRFGLTSLLPENIRMISGPGCPVCVTGNDFIDRLIAYSRMQGIIIATFGDLLRIPGSLSSLEKEKAAGADIRVVLSGLEALDIAGRSPEKTVIFPGIGFETTAPGTAVTIMEARNNRRDNFMVLSGHKIMPPAMEAIIREGTAIDGFICPGHVASITGSAIFDFIPEKYGIGCVVTGFEPADLLLAVYMLVKQVNDSRPETEIQYKRAVTRVGNTIAMGYLNEVFNKADDTWRGLGLIPSSGLAIREEFSDFDAENNLPVSVKGRPENEMCLCGEILRGRKTPEDCSLFDVICNPSTPVGSCMVSPEGACNSYFKYRTNG